MGSENNESHQVIGHDTSLNEDEGNRREKGTPF